LNSNSLEGHQVLKLATWLAKSDDFRTLQWLDGIEEPEIILQQTKQLLAV